MYFNFAFTKNQLPFSHLKLENSYGIWLFAFSSKTFFLTIYQIKKGLKIAKPFLQFTIY